MFISLKEIEEILLGGQTLTWLDPDTQKSDTLTLTKVSQRSLYKFIQKSTIRDAGNLSDQFIRDIKDAYKTQEEELEANEEVDFGNKDYSNPSWELHKIETFGFGGINQFKGDVFSYLIDGKSICLEGENGSGKSSLISAIQWALTGQIIKDKPDQRKLESLESVYSSNENKIIGTWPPIASYPHDIPSLLESPLVWVHLEFKDAASGRIAKAQRRLENGNIVEQLDPEIKKLGLFFETCILMPSRLPHINLSNKTSSLSEAIQKLTGLDSLGEIGDFVSGSGLGHSTRHFLKYSKSQGIDGKKKDYEAAITTASNSIKSITEDPYNIVDLKEKIGLETTEKELIAIREKISDEISSQLSTIKSEVPEGYDIEKNAKSLREEITDLSSQLKNNREKIIPVAADSLKSINDSLSADDIIKIEEKIAAIDKQILSAILQFKKQQNDRKLKLKILAAQYHGEVDENEEIVNCPLCEEPLTKKIELAKELNEIKKENLEIQKDFSDKMRDLKDELVKIIPSKINAQLNTLQKIDPKSQFIQELTNNLTNQNIIKNTFKGISTHLQSLIQKAEETLPNFNYQEITLDYYEVETKKLDDLYNTIKGIRRICALSVWWGDNKLHFTKFWMELIGHPDKETKKYPEESLQGKLATFMEALNQSKPYEVSLLQIKVAIDKAKEWTSINNEQELREDIVKELAPLTKLKKFVEAKSKEAISSLSSQIGSILDAIHISERLKFGETKLNKSTLIIHSQLVDSYKIDATLVANTSWIRAILWAFIFSLRNSLLEKTGFNPFPLIILDDPQSTFDSKHRRKWAEQISAFANMNSAELHRAQFFITCHDIQFVNCLEVESFSGIYSQLYPVTSYNPVLKVIDGNNVERLWIAASETQDTFKSKQYIAEVRIYIESLVRIMLQGESLSSFGGNIWGNLRRYIDEARKREIPPYNRPAFETLLKVMDESIKEVKIINHTHHYDEGDIGYSQAVDVNKFWREKAFKAIKTAFGIYREYRLVNGEPRALFASNPMITFPEGHTDVVKLSEISVVGRAAALTNGRSCDGFFSIANNSDLNKIKFFNHSAYKLASQTLEPIANKGDILLVSNFEKVNTHNNDLAVIAFDDKLLARRYERVEGHPELVALIAQAVNPKDLKSPFVIHHSSIKENVKKIIGVLYDHDDVIPNDDNLEVSEIVGSNVLSRLFKDTSLLKVDGRSAEPYALDGQYILVGEFITERSDFLDLNGKLIIATDSEGQNYFKRLRIGLQDEIIILESLDISGAEDILLFFPDRNPISQIAPVKGIIFQLPS